MAISLAIPSNREFLRFSRFLAVGTAGTILDFSLPVLLILAGLPTLSENSLSFTASPVNNFTWNRFWTFADGMQSDWRKQLAQFTVVSLIGLALNNIILLSLEEVLGSLLHQPAWGYLPAKIAATGVVVFWTYFANRSWTFKN